MARKQRSRSRNSSRDSGRRGFLLKLGGGAMAAASLGIGLNSTGAFSFVTVPRNSNVNVATDGNGIVGIVGQGPVQKNQREAMVQFTNNGTEQITITVDLDTDSEGTLYDNEGGSGSVVTFTLAAGNSQFIDIEAAVTGTITYSVGVSSSSLSLDTTGTVESEAGNVKGAVRIQQPNKDQDFTADESANEFVVDKVDIRDDDGDNDLDRIEFRVREGGSAGTLVGAKDITNPPSNRYNPNSVTIQPDPGHTIKSSTTYALTVTGYDADGNFASETVEDTTSGGGGTATPTETPTATPTETSTATPSNQAPTADFTSNRKGNSQNVDLDASPSSDPDGSIVSYEWDVNTDGSIDYTGQTVRAKISSGTPVELIVTDDGGKTDSVTKNSN